MSNQNGQAGGETLIQVRRALREAREALGLTQEQAAHQAGYKGKSAWSMIEAGKTTPSIWQMREIAKVVKRPVKDIFPEVDDATQSVG